MFVIRHTTEEEFDEIMEIYANAREYMRTHGNPDQWGNSWPSPRLVRKAIREQKSYVCTLDEKIAAVFYFDITNKDAYDELSDGEWIKDSENYGMVMQVASSGIAKGAASYCLQWACEQCDDVRSDTRAENGPMMHVLEKNGFVYCGHLNSSVRRAYQWIRR